VPKRELYKQHHETPQVRRQFYLFQCIRESQKKIFKTYTFPDHYMSKILPIHLYPQYNNHSSHWLPQPLDQDLQLHQGLDSA